MPNKPSTITVVVFRRRDSDPFEARVLQEHRLGPNLSPKTGTAEMARSAAERRLRTDGWKGAIQFEEGLPESIRSLPVDQEPVHARRGLRLPKISPSTDLFPQC
jgi:hypothetical protein